MNAIRKITKPVARVVLLCVLGMTALMPIAQASMVGTDTVVKQAQSQYDRDHLRSLFERKDIQAQLRDRGVDPAQAQARVDSMTDEEVQQIAGRLDKLPAGAGALEIVLIILILLMITDLMGVTDIYPFIKK